MPRPIPPHDGHEDAVKVHPDDSDIAAPTSRFVDNVTLDCILSAASYVCGDHPVYSPHLSSTKHGVCDDVGVRGIVLEIAHTLQEGDQVSHHVASIA